MSRPGVVIRRSNVDRAIALVTVLLLAAVMAMTIALYVQRHNQPTIVFYCDRADCVPAKDVAK